MIMDSWGCILIQSWDRTKIRSKLIHFTIFKMCTNSTNIFCFNKKKKFLLRSFFRRVSAKKKFLQKSFCYEGVSSEEFLL
jgi:hypothetical protein